MKLVKTIVLVLAIVAASIWVFFPNQSIVTFPEEEPSERMPSGVGASQEYQSNKVICTDDCPLIDVNKAPGDLSKKQLEALLWDIGKSKGISDAKIKQIEVVIGGRKDYKPTACPNGESTWNPYAIGDGGDSLGLVQINTPAHPEITPEEAFDPVFSINFITDEFIAGNEWKWSCYKAHFAMR